MAEPLPALRATHARKRRAPRSVEHPERVGVDTASKQAALRFLRGGLGVTPQVLVALHRIFVDPRMVARLVDAHRQGAPLARDVSPRLDDPRWLIEDPAFAWTPTKRDEDRALARELSALVEQLDRAVDGELAGHRRLERVRYESNVSGVAEDFAEVSEAANDAWHRAGALLRSQRYTPPYLDRRVHLPEEAMWYAVLEPLACARAALSWSAPELDRAKAALGAACSAFARCHRRLYEYRLRVEGGAQNAIDGMWIACNALVCCLAAAPAAGAVLTARLALLVALRAAGGTAAASLIGRAGMIAQGVEKFDAHKLLIGTAEEAACSFVSALIGGLLAEAFATLIGRFLIDRLSPKLLAALAEADGFEPAQAVRLAMTRGWKMIANVLGSTAGALIANVANIIVHDLRVLSHMPELDDLMERLNTQLLHNGLAVLIIEALGIDQQPAQAAR
jgi:hypothetical protein